MAKVKTLFRCTSCGHEQPKWTGQCKCGEWNTMVEVEEAQASSVAIGTKSKAAVTASEPARRARDISADSHKHQPTGIGELDRVLGGGVVGGAAIILAGPPGTGKSSLMSLVSSKFSMDRNVLYVSGEESEEQIVLRHKRTNALGDNLYIVNETDLAKVLWHIDEIKPQFLVIDSLQTIASQEISGGTGSVSQVTEVATVLTRIAKSRGIPTVFVGHFTKDGNVAGPRVVEHLVDVVLAFEGEEDSPLRLLRGIKNRFGSDGEIGCFEHTEDGLVEVPDPSGMLMGSREHSIPGVATSIYLEGRRALPVEIQAIVLESQVPNPRKGTSGLDPVRTLMLHAILQKHSGHSVQLSTKDVYVATAGNIKVRETAVDMATMIAIASDALSLPSRFDAVAIGEVSLSGEIRKVPGINRRLAEAVRLGFKAAYVPAGTRETLPESLRKPDSSGKPPITIVEVENLQKLMTVLRGVKTAIDSGMLE